MSARAQVAALAGYALVGFVAMVLLLWTVAR